MTAYIKKDGVFEERTIEVLVDAVVECCGPNGWDLYSQSDAISQQLKALSECGEACDSVNKGDREQLKDDIGDILVCLINWCELTNCEFMESWDCSTIRPPVTSTNLKGLMINVVVDISIELAVEGAEDDTIDYILRMMRQVCALSGIDIVESLGIAYDVISKRKGRMINGTFVKSEDL